MRDEVKMQGQFGQVAGLDSLGARAEGCKNSPPPLHIELGASRCDNAASLLGERRAGQGIRCESSNVSTAGTAPSGATGLGIPSLPIRMPIGVPVGGGASPIIAPVSSNATAM